MQTESHISAFLGERLQKIEGTSIAFSELWSAYEAWCAAQGRPPLSTPKFAAELKALGYEKWKSCGLIWYRGLQLAARSDGSHAVTLHPQLQPA
jgi:phage/plasmid-associated DNA primase